MADSNPPQTQPENSPLTPEEARVQAFQRLVGEVFRTNGRLLAVAERVARDLDINSARWQLIMVIRRAPQTVSQISRRLGVARQSLQVTANKLRDKGLIEFCANPEHARSPLLRLTEDGNAMMQELLKRQVKLTEIFIADTGISTQDIDNTAAALRGIRRNADKKTNGSA